MLEQIDKVDKEIFLYLNGKHGDISDMIWQFVTDIPSWIPLYLLLIGLMIWKFKKDSIFLILGVLLTILISDQFTSTFMKPFFGRLRPCHDLEIGYLVHVVKKCGGQFGFASGHSANSFGIAMYCWLVFRSYWRGSWILFLWAFAVAFSRIMVGVHYPGDILVGGMLGMCFGWMVFKLTEEVYFRVRLLPLIKN